MCRAPVFEQGASATDNSLIMAGNAIVVENNYGYTGPRSTQNGSVDRRRGSSAIDYDLAARTCTKVWRSEERSPTVVPKLSLATGLVYIYTKEPQDDGDDVWYLTALDFRTGRTVFKAFAGEGLGHNNNYAPITLGPDGSAYVGVLGGLVRAGRRRAAAGRRPGSAPRAGGTSRPLGKPCQPRARRSAPRRIGLVGPRASTAARCGCRAASVARPAGALLRRRRRADGRRARPRAARARLIVSTGPGHRFRGVGAGEADAQAAPRVPAPPQARARRVRGRPLAARHLRRRGRGG